MAKCKVCGKWAGIMQDAHYYCLNPEPAMTFAELPKPTPAYPVAMKMSTIVWGVFLGMWLFYLSAGLLTAVLYELFRR
jgi:hypothetical protein